MSPSEVLAIAGPFISGCDIGIPANPSLAVTNTGAIGPGTKLEFKSDAITGDTAGLFCQMTIGGATFSIPLPLNECVVPDINGPVLIHVTSDGNPLANSVVDRATTQLVAGPLLTFIDTKPQALSLVSKSGSGGSSGPGGSVPPVGNEPPPTPDSDETSTTQTITPGEASSIIAGATSSSAASGPVPTNAPPAGNASSAPPLSPKPNLETGPSGAIDVNGWTGNI
jgi:hypothetical protein